MNLNLYDENQFKQTFLDFDFDNILIQTNNELINSNDLYLKYKAEYLHTTQENLNKYIKLYSVLKQLSNNYIIENNKYSYTVIDTLEYNNINKDIKSLIIEQRQLFNNFMKYIQFLNSKL